MRQATQSGGPPATKRGEETTRERELADFESAFPPLNQRFEERWFNFVKGLDG